MGEVILQGIVANKTSETQSRDGQVGKVSVQATTHLSDRPQQEMQEEQLGQIGCRPRTPAETRKAAEFDQTRAPPQGS